MFNKESGLVKIFFRHIKDGTFKLEDVPELDNLKEVIIEILESGE